MAEQVKEENVWWGDPYFMGDTTTGGLLAVRNVYNDDSGIVIRREYLRASKWKPLKKPLEDLI